MNRYSKYSEKAALNNRVFNVKVLIIGTFNQKKALEGAFSVIVKLHLRLVPSSGGCSGAGLMSRGGWPGRDCWPRLAALSSATLPPPCTAKDVMTEPSQSQSPTFGNAVTTNIRIDNFNCFLLKILSAKTYTHRYLVAIST